MFKKLKYSVTFPDTGRSLAQDIEMKSGFWAITGPNECGKSMVFEMLRFGLFGGAALRGETDDYKTLQMSAEFDIRGEAYKVERTIKKATLWRGEEVVATGITSVNQKIVALLGFGLLVFDVACSINQGEVERLGSMTSTERKRMVDQVLGIDSLDVVAKWGMDEAKILDREAEAIRRTLIEPVMPQEPVGYVPTVNVNLDQLRADARELAQIEGYLAAPRRPRPVEPVTTVTETLDELKPKAETQAQLRRARAELNAGISALPASAPYTEQQLATAEAAYAELDKFDAAQSWLRTNPKPTHTLEQLQGFVTDYANLDVLQEYAGLEAKLVKLEDEGSKPCPHCGTDILHSHDEVAAVKAKIAAMEITTYEVVTPTVPRSALPGLIAYAEHFDATKHQQMSEVQAVPMPAIDRMKIPGYRAAITQVTLRAGLEAKLAELPTDDTDWEAKLRDRSAYELQLAGYTVDLQHWQAGETERAEKEKRQTELAGATDRLKVAEERYQIDSEYERALNRFGAAFDAYQKASAEAATKTAEAEKYRKVRQLMDVLRSLIKQHLMPSLNKVASHLLQGMTGGQRQSIHVDEDFNIMVDNQRLDTLSGSGKACANLALRIALGQVLTNRVMSVLLADEIDGSMDDFRAQQTSNILWISANSICQVMLISHKPIEVENVIQLGGFNATPLGSELGAA